jgi:hypothetical protein
MVPRIAGKLVPSNKKIYSILAEIYQTVLQIFYPLLAEVGMEILKERAWLECAVARRFVQYSG